MSENNPNNLPSYDSYPRDIKTYMQIRTQYRSKVNLKKGELISVTPLKSFKS